MGRGFSLLAACTIALTGCGAVERASVVITPRVGPLNDWNLTTAAPRVTETFRSVTRVQGYRCHSSMRKVGEQVCTGPRDLAMRFKRRDATSGYVARFSWMDTQGRNAAEFRRHVDAFARAFEDGQSPAEVAVRYGTTDPW